MKTQQHEYQLLPSNRLPNLHSKMATIGKKLEALGFKIEFYLRNTSGHFCMFVDDKLTFIENDDCESWQPRRYDMNWTEVEDAPRVRTRTQSWMTELASQIDSELEHYSHCFTQQECEMLKAISAKAGKLSRSCDR